MKAHYKHLCEHSVSMALAAIEIYNKPNFPQREQAFCILMTTAWECLLKAKLVREDGLASLRIRESNGYHYKRKRARPGQPASARPYFTIGLSKALTKCSLPDVVVKNIEALQDIRDAAVHLVVRSAALPSVVFQIGTATLRNYARLANRWFGVDLGEYSFFILPLGFSYPFEAFTVEAVGSEPLGVAQVIRDVAEAQASGLAEGDGFHLVCEIETHFKSAKKVTESTDFISQVGGGDPDATFAFRKQKLLDAYPLGAREMVRRVMAESGENQRVVYEVMRQIGVRDDENYAARIYLSKDAEARGPTPSTTIVYKVDAVRYLVECINNFG